MSKRVELPIVEPLYSTYHFQGPATAVIYNNQSIIDWYLNEIMNLMCSHKFLSGFTTPELNIQDSSWYSSPFLERQCMTTQFFKGYINPIIREMIDEGYYVAFNCIDDYYVKGKSWYRERHFNHDGLICGYDQNDKSYCIYAYDSDWVYRKFWTPQKAFNAGRISAQKKGVYGCIEAIKPRPDPAEFSPTTVCKKIEEYLDSNLDKYPFKAEGLVYGLVVHEYIAEYIGLLYSGFIPYERMDRRVFRLIWEHKKVMLQRIVKLEHVLEMSNEHSEKYKHTVSQANTMRMLYASHHIKRRDSVLPIIQKNLLMLMDYEKDILTSLVAKAKKEAKYEPMAIS